MTKAYVIRCFGLFSTSSASRRKVVNYFCFVLSATSNEDVQRGGVARCGTPIRFFMLVIIKPFTRLCTLDCCFLPSLLTAFCFPDENTKWNILNSVWWVAVAGGRNVRHRCTHTSWLIQQRRQQSFICMAAPAD